MPALDRKADYLSASGAYTLADAIRDYWSKRGHDVHVYVCQEPQAREALPLYNVRSRMVGGWP